MTSKGVVIETRQFISEFGKKFQSDILELKKKNVDINYIIRDKGQGKIWLCLMERKSEEEGNLSPLLHYYLSGILSDFILEPARRTILENLMHQNYSYFNRTEREVILSLTLHKLNQEDKKSSYFYNKSYLANRFKEYFKNNDFVNIEGFIFFRLKKMLSHLRYNVESTIDEYLEEQEYQELVRLLKHFVSLGDTEIKTEEIHLTLDQEGEFVLRDKGFNLLAMDINEGISLSPYNSNLQKADLIVTALVNYSPQKIIIHRRLFEIYPKAVEVVLNVFGDRVLLCKKCHLCRKQQVSQDIID